tara:strand:- start:1196 stop:1981 length:786 start_codon:yes stop_codon:yes gene_type:complete
VGEQVYISVPECGISGNATVLQIEDCPPLAPRPGPGFQIVTGTFQHEAAQTLDISVEDESKPIGTTPNHPIWSVDREAFVRADSLTVGERLQTLNGIARITNITARGPPEPVYNLEVQVKHTYFVADSGVLVHNGTLCGVGNGSSNTNYKTWNQFQKGTKGQFGSRTEAGKAWKSYKEANGIAATVNRNSSTKRNFLKGLANDLKTPSWMKQWLKKGRNPPGYDVDHIKPISIGGEDSVTNLRLQLRELHKIHHKFYRPWE